MKKTTLTARLAALLLAGTLALGLAGCSAASNGTADAVAIPDQTESSTSQEISPTADGAGTEPGGSAMLDPATLDSDRKLIYNASVSLESTDFDGARQAIQEAVEQTGSYLQSSELWGNAESANRSAYYTVRVPAEQYSTFLSSLGEAGSLLNQQESVSDVSTQYIDLEARLTSLETQRDRLNQLAAQADTTADLLEIESQLSDVQYQIESYTAQMRDLDNRIAYSTVDIHLSEVAVLSPTGVSFADRAFALFLGGWQNAWVFVQELTLQLIYRIPLILVVIVLVVVVILLRRRHRKRKADRRSSPPHGWPPAGTGTSGTTGTADPGTQKAP